MGSVSAPKLMSMREAVARFIGLPESRLCQACLTGHYPTPKGEQLYQLALRNNHANNGNGRTYEATAAAVVKP